VFDPPLEQLLPVAALTGVLFMVVVYTFDWSCIGPRL
jgi:MFS superfamily sulfate permease-like transporter